MSLTFLAKSSAYSWKMSFDGHVLWKRKLIGPCALTTLGAVTVAAVATAAPLRNLRRLVIADVRDLAVDMWVKPPCCLAPGFSPYRSKPPGRCCYSSGGGRPFWQGAGRSPTPLYPPSSIPP